MKHPIKRYWFYILTLCAGIFGMSWLEYKSKISDEIFLGSIATFITLFLSVINYYQSNDKFFKELFIEFNQRYNGMDDFLNSLTNDSTINNAKDRQRIVEYLILCAEEYMWVKKGRIPMHVWKNWRTGIEVHLSKLPIRKIYEEENIEKGSYYGFFEEMNNCLTK